jgi:hypothetical protein
MRDLLKSLKLESVELANTSNARSSNWVERVSAWTATSLLCSWMPSATADTDALLESHVGFALFR